MKAALLKVLRQLDPHDVFIVGGLLVIFAGVWMTAGLGRALWIVGALMFLTGLVSILWSKS